MFADYRKYRSANVTDPAYQVVKNHINENDIFLLNEESFLNFIMGNDPTIDFLTNELINKVP